MKDMIFWGVLLIVNIICVYHGDSTMLGIVNLFGTIISLMFFLFYHFKGGNNENKSNN
jgi:hypothetical protein